jgi:hypothetical protein
MEKAKIFLISKDKRTLVPMEETSYTAEDELQAYLARHPDLLPGDQINPEAPRRWLLVAREMGVPGSESGGNRWSLDHLFVDQDGIPTFVECKRASDTRGRREVVAQMLDYAANGIQYWPIDRLRQAAAETASNQGKSLDEQILTLVAAEESDFEAETAIEDFWSQVETNLRSGKVRLVFVADELPRELRRLIEFMNEKMADVEVLGVTIKQYQGHDLDALVPRVIGVTEASRDKKAPTSTRKMPLSRADLLAGVSPPVASFFESVLDLAEARGHTIRWGKKSFTVRAYMPEKERLAGFCYGWISEVFQFYFAQLQLPDREAQDLRRQLMAFGVFRPAGEKTLEAKLSQETLAKMPEVYNFILNKIDEIVRLQ